MRTRSTKITCDICGKQEDVEWEDAPRGWYRVSICSEDRKTGNHYPLGIITQDVCEVCIGKTENRKNTFMKMWEKLTNPPQAVKER